ncbi:MAG: hypothetical protein JW812_03855 [Alphaproteobacteria bacterium]|nr:hypothetical protein [Alphaproteobacteria bacterium]MBN2780005.1 hypothetical protein [Alphaproteobacteria bacterium]
MTTQTIILVALGLYFMFLLFVGWMSGRNQTDDSFIIGSRNVGLIPTIGSLAAGFRDGAGIVLWVGLGFSLGYSGFWLVAGMFLGLSLMAYFGQRVREIARKKNYVTVGQMLRDQIGPKIAKSLSAIVLLFAALVVSMQLFVAGNLLSNILGYAPWIGIVIIATIIALYLYAGGYSSVIKTDFIQFFLMISFISIPFFLPPAKADVFNLKQLFQIGEQDIAFFGIGFVIVLSLADNWQRIFSARSKNVIRWGFPLAAPALAVLTLSLIFLGMAAKGLLPTSTNPDDVFFALFKSNAVSSYLLAYIAVVAIATTMSTLDTQTYLFSSTYLEDFSKVNIQNNQKEYIRKSRWIMTGILAVMGLTAVYIADLIQFAFSAYGVIYIFAPIFVLTGLNWFKKSEKLDKALTAALWGNLVLWGFLWAFGFYVNSINTLIPALTMFASVITVHLILRKQKA